MERSTGKYEVNAAKYGDRASDSVDRFESTKVVKNAHGFLGLEQAAARSTDHQGSRRLFMAAALLATGTAVGLSSTPVQAIDTASASDFLQWQASPINKRSGVTVTDAEQTGYNVAFVTYLSRFLLSFDAGCQQWWAAQASNLPRLASADVVDEMRLQQFAAFSASVAVGLLEYGGKDGPRRLMKALLQRYCPEVQPVETETLSESARKGQNRKIKEARRQIALLFGLMETNQPVKEITKLLAAIDNGSIASVEIQSEGTGYISSQPRPLVKFPPPDADGSKYETATGVATMAASNGKLFHIEVNNPGMGYTEAPIVTISPPLASIGNETVAASVATAKASIVQSGVKKGQIETIQLIDPGAGYTSDEIIQVSLSPPELSPDDGGVNATATAILELKVAGIQIINGGSGYVVEKSISVYVEPPPAILKPTNKSSPVIAVAYPIAEKDSYTSFRKDQDKKAQRKADGAWTTERVAASVSGSTSGHEGGLPTLPFWGSRSSSSQLVSLLPAGIGLDYQPALKRYILTADTNFKNMYPELVTGSSTKPLDPKFGPRGRSPIERDMELSFSTYLRFALSGAICSSSVHLALTPIDVVKTKLQTKPEKYDGIVDSFQKVWKEEGPSSFFTGWVPTALGHFFLGGCIYTLAELFRRFLIDVAGPISAANYEIPIILLSAGFAAFWGAFVISPFESVRIRSVAQPDYSPRFDGVVVRMVQEEGIGSLFSAVPLLLVKGIPYSMAKFTVFDLSTEWMYKTFPAAQEDFQLSLLVSLFCGTLAGIAAALVSNPADATISEMKKKKTDMGPLEAAQMVFDRGGFAGFFKGLQLRMIYYPLVVSLQFLVYDVVRFNLGIGSDDLKLYLDVLGGALNESGGPV
jgi:solute carrier family 25 (mitochondrial phosphate transporter), member 3